MNNQSKVRSVVEFFAFARRLAGCYDGAVVLPLRGIEVEAGRVEAGQWIREGAPALVPATGAFVSGDTLWIGLYEPPHCSLRPLSLRGRADPVARLAEADFLPTRSASTPADRLHFEARSWLTLGRALQAAGAPWHGQLELGTSVKKKTPRRQTGKRVIAPRA